MQCKWKTKTKNNVVCHLVRTIYLEKPSEMGFVGGGGKLPVHIQTVEAVLPEIDHDMPCKPFPVDAGDADGFKVAGASGGPADG